GEPVKAGSQGELFIGGLGVARGYLKRPRLNRLKFITRGGERLYKTGDLIKMTEQGEYEFLGRCDRQFKLRGLLVEPEEIETRLAEIEGVERASVQKLSTGRRDCLVAFIQSHVDGVPQPALLRQELSRSLPGWMLPQRFVYRQALPLTTTGKVDLEALRQIWNCSAMSSRAVAELSDSSELEHGLTDTSDRLKEIWCQVLALPRAAVGLDDDFFDLGGDSFSVLEIVVAAEAKGIVLAPELLLRERTISRLAAVLAGGQGADISFSMSADSLRERVNELVAEARLEENCAQPDKYTCGAGKGLVTGATGFLGSRLLLELLAQSNLDFVCLVRARDHEEGMARLRKAAARHGRSFTAADEERIEIVLGDVSSSFLGLSQQSWESLTEKVGAIYHNAAQVNMLLDYRELEPVNTKSTIEIVRLMRAGRPMSLHYASTLSVFVATDKNFGRLMEEDDLSSTGEVFGGYAQSKWAGELLLRKLAKDCDSVFIYRLGLLTADANCGKAAENDFLEMFVRGINALGYVPDTVGDVAIDITPVDFSARAMSSISLSSDSEGIRTFHIANPESLHLSALIEFMKSEKPSLKTVSLEQFRHVVREWAHSSTEASAASLALCRVTGDSGYFRSRRSMDLFQATDVTFDMTNTTKSLAGTEITCPPPDAHLIRQYVRAALD
ncbi:MAG: thioester reductase domain-containing protein, partial [Cyanobacteria bacterium]|nr:thioester reductase domain-containing protein [Cyanobacteriota bacterium]